MAYIFTEIFNTFFFNCNIIYDEINLNFIFLSKILNVYVYTIINALIGFCHFYYQLGYGLVIYIYIYKKLKKKKNYLNVAVLNWIFFNLLVFGKSFSYRHTVIYIVHATKKLFMLTYFLINFYTKNSKIYFIFNKFYTYNTRILNKFSWTPLFKRSSYITFVSVLKRFNKRK